MKSLKVLFLFFALFSNLFAFEGIKSDSLYLSYYKTPKKLFVNQIFPITIKIIVTEEEYKDLSFNLENSFGLSPVSVDIPQKKDGIYIYKTFYFKALNENIKLPDIVAYLLKDDYSPIIKNRLVGKSLKAIRLNPPKDFCNVLAKSLKIDSFQPIKYDEDKNIIIINLEGNLSNLEDFHLDFAKDEKIESINQNFPITSITYMAKIPSFMKKLKFSYFNLEKNRFEYFINDILVKDDSVSTQSDIDAGEDEHKVIKVAILLSLSSIFLILAIFKKSLLYLLIASVFGGFGAYYTIPLKTVCIKEDSKISLLPTKNSTIFYITNSSFKTKRLNHTNGYTKIKLPNNKIGWVKDEDLCKD